MTKIIYYFSVALALLAALSSGSCAKEEEEPMGDRLPANTVHAVYRLTGTVVDQATTQPIPGLEVKITDDNQIIKNEQSKLKTVTDSRGKFELMALVISAEKGFDFEITISDKSETYESRVIPVGFDNPQFANGDGDLFLGETVREMVTIELSVKTVEEPSGPDQGGQEDTNTEGVE